MKADKIPDGTSCPVESSYAFFMLDDQEFGIKVESVRETILNTSKLTKMPTSVDVIDGLINLRGSIIPIINLRKRLNIDPTPLSSSESPIAIVQFNEALFGLVFDEISEVVRVDESEINTLEMPEEDLELCSLGVLSLDEGERIVQLLDMELLFKKYNLPHFNNMDNGSRRVFRPRVQDVTFMLDGQEYAININSIREIISPPKTQRKILVDPSIKGIISLRGEVINIVDLRHYFNLNEDEIQQQNERVIILQGPLNCGVLVDSIIEVIHYEEDRILPVPLFEQGQEKFSGIAALENGRNIIRVDTEKLFDDHMVKQLQGNLELHKDEGEDRTSRAKNLNDKPSTLADTVLISFHLGDDYAFDIRLFHEIINYPIGIVSLPGSVAYHEGILNLRNSAIPIINLRKYYGMEDYANIKDTKIIILNLPDKTIGVMVDDIIEIVKPDSLNIEQFPRIAVNDKGQSVSHVNEGFRIKTIQGDDKSLLIFDVEQLIKDIDAPGEEKLRSVI